MAVLRGRNGAVGIVPSVRRRRNCVVLRWVEMTLGSRLVEMAEQADEQSFDARHSSLDLGDRADRCQRSRAYLGHVRFELVQRAARHDEVSREVAIRRPAVSLGDGRVNAVGGTPNLVGEPETTSRQQIRDPIGITSERESLLPCPEVLERANRSHNAIVSARARDRLTTTMRPTMFHRVSPVPRFAVRAVSTAPFRPRSHCRP
jgi:hypothetical protein